MDWRLKCLAFHAIKHLPGGPKVHRWAQHRVTGRYFLTLKDDKLPMQRWHIANYERLGRPCVALEFGAGTHLLTALMLSAAGARVHALDVDRLASVDRINHVIRNLRDLRLSGNWRDLTELEDLERYYSIQYHAPVDARQTGLSSGSVDFFYSSSVMEHIPENDLRTILRECIRLASRDALMSFSIGYYDHYATADRSISKFNFYRYGDALWRIYNPSHHHQNRLRHSDFERIFRELGLVMLTNERTCGESQDLQRVPVHPRFGHYSDDDLLTVGGRFLLKVERVV
jgi:hypothetical protein